MAVESRSPNQVQKQDNTKHIIKRQTTEGAEVFFQLQSSENVAQHVPCWHDKITEVIFSGAIAYPSLLGKENSKEATDNGWVISRSEAGGQYLSFLELTLLRHCLEFYKSQGGCCDCFPPLWLPLQLTGWLRAMVLSCSVNRRCFLNTPVLAQNCGNDVPN